MSIELPAMIIYGDDFGSVRPGGLPAPMPAAMLARAMEERSGAYALGHWREMLKLHLPMMRTTRPTPYALHGIIIREFKAGAGADAMMLRSPTVSFSQAWRASFEEVKANLDVSQMAAPIEFSGGLFTPFVAIAHWLLGKGQQASININNIGISPKIEKMPILKTAIDSAIVGSSRLDVSFPYDTGQDSNVARVYLGSITLRVLGDLKKDADGSVSFSGVIRAYSDRYDANASNHRAEFDEGATTVLRKAGQVANAQSYDILIKGDMPFNM